MDDPPSFEMPLNPALVWLLAGIALCLVELVVPTAFIAFVLGLSALAVAALAPILPFGFQILLWVALSLVLVLVSRRFVRSRGRLKLDATEAETLTEILPGKTGRVLYEGNSWRARCESEMTIAAHQKVYVVARQGTTLLVMPETLLRQ